MLNLKASLHSYMLPAHSIPIVYKFDSDLRPIPPSGDRQTAFQLHMNGLFLEKPGLLKEALKREAEWIEKVPGYNTTFGDRNGPMTSLERSLFKLQAERELGEWAGQFVNSSALVEDDGSDGNGGRPMQIITKDQVWKDGRRKLQINATKQMDGTVDPTQYANLISNNQPCVTTLSKETAVRQNFIVIIRHGKTEHNKLGLFTGWEDAPLAKEGIEEAIQAGRLLKAHGFEFDVVYTSWLSRAIETAWLVIDELDLLWLPIVKTWRLNER